MDRDTDLGEVPDVGADVAAAASSGGGGGPALTAGPPTSGLTSTEEAT